MIAELHRTKADRIAQSLKKCTSSDYEAVIEGAMLAATHWFNYALHAYGFRSAEQDVMHAEFLTKAERGKLSLISHELIDYLDEIEDSRALYVRGSAEGGEAMAHRALDLLDRIRTIALTARPLGLS